MARPCKIEAGRVEANYRAMPTCYIALSLTPPPSPRHGDVIHLLRRAVETAICVAVESPPGMIVECDAASGMALE